MAAASPFKIELASIAKGKYERLGCSIAEILCSVSGSRSTVAMSESP